MKRLLVIAFILSNLLAQSQNWIGFGSGANNSIYSLYNDTLSNKLIVAGMFTTINGVSARGIATWDGIQFLPMDLGVNYLYGSVPTGALDMISYNSKLHVCGVAKLGNYFINGMGTWNGATWDTLAEKTDGSVRAMEVNGIYLYACGVFDTAGIFPANSVAKWDGSNWSLVGSAFPFHSGGGVPILNCLKFFNGELYVGGGFEDSTGNNMRIAKFNGTNWQNAGIHILGGISSINTMEVYNNELYVGGMFTTADGNLDNAIMRYDGTSWKAVGGGVNGAGFPQITKLKEINGDLYAVGIFNSAGGVPAENIAKWDGTNWCGLGSTINNKILAIENFNSETYIGGAFDIADGNAVNYLAKWTGTGTDTCGHISLGINEALKEITLNLYPNPVEDFIAIEFEGEGGDNTIIEIKNILGRTIKAIRPASILNGKNTIETSINELVSGIYLMQLSQSGRIATKKFIKE